MIEESTSAAKAIAEAAPPITVTACSFMGLPMQDWVYVLTAAYTLVQLIRLLPKILGCTKCFCKHWTCPRNCKGY